MALNNGEGLDGIDGFERFSSGKGVAQKKPDDFGPVVIAMIVVIIVIVAVVVIVAFIMSHIAD